MTTTTTMTTTERRLLAEIAEIRAELVRRDIEQVAVENAVEFLHKQERTLRYVLGALVKATLGNDDTRYGGKWMHSDLYPEPVAGMPFKQAPAMVFERPARRWKQFGSKTELLELAKKVGMKTNRNRHTAEWLVRDLWDVRALPGSVALYRGDAAKAS